MADEPDDVARRGESLAALERAASNAGRALTNAFTVAQPEGKRLDEVVRTLGERLVRLGATSLQKPLEQGLTSAFSGLGNLLGGSGAPLSITPFADGGIVANPTFFQMPGGLGLAGERGAEAILPLARGADGRLGVASSGGAGRNVSVAVTINTPDAESFRRSEAQVSAQLARAVARGQRGL